MVTDADVPVVESGGKAHFIDPAGYKAYVTERVAAFRNELAKQKAARQSDGRPK
jgi:hypothetical protein